MTIKRCYPVIVGASVAENQLASVNGLSAQTSNGVTFTPNADGSYTITGTATGRVQTPSNVFARFTITNNHKYAVVITGALGSLTVRFASGLSSNITRQSTIVNCTADTNAYVTFDSLTAITDTFNISNLHVSFIDLTAKFGSSIADYVYTLEQATAGSGIAWLRSYGFLKGYQAYNAGSIESVEVTGKKVVGFNQWDEEWEVGDISASNGQNVANTGIIRSKNYIPVIPGATYFDYIGGQASLSLRTRFYDADKNYIGTAQKNGSAVTYNSTFVIPDNCYYMRFTPQSGYGTTYNNDICINLSSDRNGEYEPYSAHTYDLGTDTLRGLFKLDSNNNLYADGDTKTSDGTVTRKYGVVDLGTLTYGTLSQGVYYVNLSQYGYVLRGGAVCEKYPVVSTTYTDAGDKVITTNSTGVGNAPYIIIKDSSYSNNIDFKSAMSGVMLVYELATPTTEQSTPFTSPQICYPDGTEEFVTETDVPVGHETKYQL